MLRRLLNMASFVSLLAGVAIAVLWVRSDAGVQEIIAYRVHRYSASLDHGRFSLERCTCAVEYSTDTGWEFDPAAYSPAWRFAIGPRPVDHNGECDQAPQPPPAPGESVPYPRPSQETREELAAGPVWPLALGAFTPPLALALRRIARAASVRRRLRVGHCPACGYDLNATPARCPECGRRAEDPRGEDRA